MKVARIYLACNGWVKLVFTIKQALKWLLYYYTVVTHVFSAEDPSIHIHLLYEAIENDDKQQGIEW